MWLVMEGKVEGRTERSKDSEIKHAFFTDYVLPINLSDAHESNSGNRGEMVQRLTQNTTIAKPAEQRKREPVLVTGRCSWLGCIQPTFHECGLVCRACRKFGTCENERMLKEDLSAWTHEDGHLLILPTLTSTSLLQGDGCLHTH